MDLGILNASLIREALVGVICVIMCLSSFYSIKRLFDSVDKKSKITKFNMYVIGASIIISYAIPMTYFIKSLVHPIFYNSSYNYGGFRVNEGKTTVIADNIDEIRLREWVRDTSKMIPHLHDLSNSKISSNIKIAAHDYTKTLYEIREFILTIRFDSKAVEDYLLYERSPNIKPSPSSLKIKNWLESSTHE